MVSNDDRGAAVPDVRRVVGRRSALVDRHRALTTRHELDLRACRGVVDAKHAPTLIATARESRLPPRVIRERGAPRPRPRCLPPVRSRRGLRRASASPTRGSRGPSAVVPARARRSMRSTIVGHVRRELRRLGRDDDVDVVDPPARLWRSGRDIAQQRRASRRRGSCSSVAGNSEPRSGKPAAPSSASATACATASPSEWPREAGRVVDAAHRRARVEARRRTGARRTPGRRDTSRTCTRVEQRLRQLEVGRDR